MANTWTEMKSSNSWLTFKIMGEFVAGYEKMSKIGPCVSIFGSARTKPDNEYYKLAERIAKKIHDEVANNMVNIMNKVQYTENPKEALLDDLEKVYLLTRDISHQNNSIETGAHFEPFLKSMLTSFNSNTTTVILKDIQKVEMALTILKFSQKEASNRLEKLLMSAITNWQSKNEDADVEEANLFIKEIPANLSQDKENIFLEENLTNFSAKIARLVENIKNSEGIVMDKSLGVVMDPIGASNYHKDTSLALLLAAQRYGYQLFYMEQSDLFLDNSGPNAKMAELHVYEDEASWFALSEPTIRPLADLDVILMRKDPPFDSEFIY